MKKGQGLVIICFVVFVFSFLAGHNFGFISGRNEGYDVGYIEGHDNGYQLGHSEGYTAGYGNGYDDGLDEGYPLGHSEGYAAGYENGYDNGIDVGRIHGYNRWDPTYAEMLEFVQRDTTNENTYIEGVYECWDFAADVCRNADAENLRVALVYILLVDGAHAIVAFDTIDKGLVFIESISDERMYPEVGKPYWPRDGYLPPYYDDTILKISIIW